MSKAIKTVASIALPIVGGIVGGPVGAAVGGAIGGAVGGGGIKGAAIGAIGGYASAGGLSGVGGAAGAGGSLIGKVAHTLPAGVSGPVSYGSGIVGALTGGGMRALATTASGIASDPSRLLMMAGNQIMGDSGADAAKKAAAIQAGAANKAIKAQNNAQARQEATMKPFVEQGTSAATQLNAIEADKAGYIQNNPLYTSLANDAQSRLFANQAAKGKLNSGGTKAALQEQLLNIGNGLYQQDVGNLQTRMGLGQNAAAGVGAGQLNTGANISNLTIGRGDSQAAGVMGVNNAQQSSYQNTINTLLALQNLNKVPQYSPANI